MIGELLNLTFRIFRFRFRVLALLGVGGAVPATVVGLTFNALSFGDLSFDPGAQFELENSPHFTDSWGCRSYSRH